MPWSLRCATSSEKFQPLGAQDPVDLRRFLMNRGVPRFDRSRLPLLVDANDQILWAPGVEIARFCRIRPDTGNCFELRVSRG